MPRVVVQDMKASLSFNGTSDVVTTGFNSFTSQMTYAGWAYRTNTGANHALLGGNVSTGPTARLESNANTIKFFTDTTQSSTTFTNAECTAAGIAPGKWFHWIFVVDTSADTCRLIINGVPVRTVTLAADYNATPGVLVIGRRSSGSDWYNGKQNNVRIFNRLLTDTEAAALYAADVIPSGCIGRWNLQEGAGSTANDTAGSNNGTLTGGTWSSDTPTKARRLVNQNLISNGDFEYAPPFVAATNTSGRWVDGTAAGGTGTDSIFGWATLAGTTIGTYGASFDTANGRSSTAALKLSLGAANSGLEVAPLTSLNAANLAKYAIPVRPSTAYTLTYWMKTNYTSGDGTEGAYMTVNERDASNGSSVVNAGTVVKTTTGWTQYTVSFTTASTTRYVVPRVTLKGQTGAATLIMDAWFDDIQLTETTPLGRSVVQDFKSSLSFGSGNKIVVGNVAAMNFGADFTVAATLKLRGYGGGYRDIISKWSGGFVFQVDATTNKLIVNEKALVVPTSTAELPYGEWLNVVYTRVGSVRTMYVNGRLFYTVTNATIPAFTGTDNVEIGSLTGGSQNMLGNLINVRAWSAGLTAEQVVAMHTAGIVPASGLVGEWKLQEGAGTTATDTSGNGNNGTITGATYSSDTPMKRRALVGGNLVPNGDFSYYPPFTAALTTNVRYLDGTAAGSATNTLFGGWAAYTGAINASAEASFDTTVTRGGTPSIRLSTLNAVGIANVALFRNNAPTEADRAQLIPVLPSTSYTGTVWIKTTNAAASAVWVDFRELTGSVSLSTSNLTTKLSGTNDWTQYSVTFTTNATTRYISPMLRNNVAGNVSDAYFNTVFLQKTTPDTRTQVT